MTVGEMTEIADKVAKYYARRCRWADPRDIRQEALVTMLRAARTYDPERGELRPYLTWEAWHAVRMWLWAFSAPVRQRPDRNLGALLGVPPRDRQDTSPDPERALELARARGKITCVLGGRPLAAKVLLGWRSREVAAEERVPVGRVYRETREARQMLRDELSDY